MMSGQYFVTKTKPERKEIKCGRRGLSEKQNSPASSDIRTNENQNIPSPIRVKI